MATIATAQPKSSPAPAVPPDWVPRSLYRLTLEQYEAMVEAGILAKRDPVHLINGFLAAKMTHNDLHATIDEICGDELKRVIRLAGTCEGGNRSASPDQAGIASPSRIDPS